MDDSDIILLSDSDNVDNYVPQFEHVSVCNRKKAAVRRPSKPKVTKRKRKKTPVKRRNSKKTKKSIITASPEVIFVGEPMTPPKIHISNNKQEEPEDLDDRLINIKVKRLGRVEQFPMKRSFPLTSIYEQISQCFDVSVHRIQLYLKERLIDRKETPNSINLRRADVFSLILKVEADNDTSGKIELHLINGTRKKLIFYARPYDQAQAIVDFYRSQIKTSSTKKIKLLFDNDEMCLTKKIDSFDMENGDQIDVLELD